MLKSQKCFEMVFIKRGQIKKRYDRYIKDGGIINKNKTKTR